MSGESDVSRRTLSSFAPGVWRGNNQRYLRTMTVIVSRFTFVIGT